MSNDFTINALVLREVNYRDSDKILTLLTAERGKCTATARGARSLKSRRRAACQALTLSEFTLSEYRDRLTVAEAVTLEPFLALRGDILKLSLGAYICQALETASPEGVECAGPLRLGLNCLAALCREGADTELIRAAFELRLACESGFMPELERCPVCGSETPDRFSLKNGTVCCANCPSEGLSMPLSPPSLAALRRAASCELKRIAAFKLDGEAKAEFSQTAEAYLQSSLEVALPTLSFYKSLFL